MGPFDYVLREERELPIEERTTWHLRTLSEGEYEEVESGTSVESLLVGGFSSVLVHGKARKILNFALLGWTNFDGVAGRVEAPRRAGGPRAVLTSECLDSIEPFMIELANAITERKALSVDARKNS